MLCISERDNKREEFFSTYHIRGHMLSIQLTTCDVNCDHLVKFLHCKVTVFLFEIIYAFWGETLKLYKYSVSLILPTRLASLMDLAIVFSW